MLSIQMYYLFITISLWSLYQYGWSDIDVIDALCLFSSKIGYLNTVYTRWGF